VRRGFRTRKPERSEARGGAASQQPGKLDSSPSSCHPHDQIRLCRRRRLKSAGKWNPFPHSSLSLTQTASHGFAVKAMPFACPFSMSPWPAFMFHGPKTSTQSIPKDKVEAAAMRPCFLLFRGKPHLRPVFPLCLPPAAIHPFLPIAVMEPACLRRQVSRQPLTFHHQSNKLTTTPCSQSLHSPAPSPPEGASFLTPSPESGRQLCTTARGELAQFIASRQRLTAFQRLPFAAPYVSSGAGHAPLDALRAMEKTIFSLQCRQYPIKPTQLL
jgi:hypothetical protein